MFRLRPAGDRRSGLPYDRFLIQQAKLDVGHGRAFLTHHVSSTAGRSRRRNVRFEGLRTLKLDLQLDRDHLKWKHSGGGDGVGAHCNAPLH